jgi:hypothetical protein
MSEVRPIGTEFWWESPVSVNHNGYQLRFLERVTGHTNSAGGVGPVDEVIVPVRMERRIITSQKWVTCDKCGIGHWEFEFGEWEFMKDNEYRRLII